MTLLVKKSDIKNDVMANLFLVKIEPRSNFCLPMLDLGPNFAALFGPILQNLFLQIGPLSAAKFGHRSTLELIKSLYTSVTYPSI